MLESSPAETHPTVMFLQLEAWIAWPTDHASRSRFLAVAGGQGAEHQRQRLEEVAGGAEQEEIILALSAFDALYQRSGGLRMVLHSPALPEVVEEYWQATHVARQAGRILDWVSRLYHDPRTSEHASVNLAKDIVTGLLPTKIKSATPMETSQVPLDRAWAMRRCVAGHAAAVGRFRAYAWEAGRVGGNQLPMEITAGELASVLRLAARLDRFATTFVPKRRNQPILRQDELAQAPFTATALLDGDELTTAPIPDEVLKFINSKRKRPIKDWSTC
jgi:hypothetical protein